MQSVGSTFLALIALSCALQVFFYKLGVINLYERIMVGCGAIGLTVPDRLAEAAGIGLVALGVGLVGRKRRRVAL